MTTCARCGNDSTRVKKQDDHCVSVNPCTKRLRERVGIRVELENPPVHTPEGEQARIAREVRYAYYRHGLCSTCGIKPHAPGRIRCDQCHDKLWSRA